MDHPPFFAKGGGPSLILLLERSLEDVVRDVRYGRWRADGDSVRAIWRDGPSIRVHAIEDGSIDPKDEGTVLSASHHPPSGNVGGETHTEWGHKTPEATGLRVLSQGLNQYSVMA